MANGKMTPEQVRAKVEKEVLEPQRTGQFWAFMIWLVIFAVIAIASLVAFELLQSLVFSFILFVALSAGIILLRLEVVDENFNGGMVIFGYVYKAVGSGLTLMPPFGRLKLLSKEPIALNFPVTEVITKADWEKVKEEDVWFETIEVQPVITVVARFPGPAEEINVLQALTYLPEDIFDYSPVDIDNMETRFQVNLRNRLAEVVNGTTRRIGARHTWWEINNNRERFLEEIKAAILQPGNIFDLTGLSESIEVTLRKLGLPDAVVNAFNARQAAKYNADAAAETARGEKEAQIQRADGARYEAERKADAEAYKTHIDAETESVVVANQIEKFGFELGSPVAERILAIRTLPENLVANLPKISMVSIGEDIPSALAKLIFSSSGKIH